MEPIELIEINPRMLMFKSWAKTFLASILLLYSTGNRNWYDLINAGVAGLIPVVLAWLDPQDPRFGRTQ